MLTVVHDQESSNEKNDGVGRSLLDRIVRDGARQMLTAALLVEVAAYVDAHAGEVDESGYRLVVRNGYHDRADRADRGGRRSGESSAGQRQARRPANQVNGNDFPALLTLPWAGW